MRFDYTIEVAVHKTYTVNIDNNYDKDVPQGDRGLVESVSFDTFKEADDFGCRRVEEILNERWNDE